VALEVLKESNSESQGSQNIYFGLKLAGEAGDWSYPKQSPTNFVQRDGIHKAS
jgi:hypothetical protein